MNLGLNHQQRINAWLNYAPAENIQRVRNDTSDLGKKMWSTALATVDAVTPTLQKFQEVFVSETDDVEVAMYVMYDPNTNQTICSTIKMDEGKLSPCAKETDALIVREWIASFLVDFPNAVFSTNEAVPLYLRVKTKNQQDFQTQNYHVTCNRILELEQQGYSQFFIFVPAKPKDANAHSNSHSNSTCRTTSSNHPDQQ